MVAGSDPFALGVAPGGAMSGRRSHSKGAGTERSIVNALKAGGLHPVPAKPRPSFHRLGRYDSTGLVWLLHGRPVIALTSIEATICAVSGATLTYRKLKFGAGGA
jgi:hypothetical protein